MGHALWIAWQVWTGFAAIVGGVAIGRWVGSRSFCRKHGHAWAMLHEVSDTDVVALHGQRLEQRDETEDVILIRKPHGAVEFACTRCGRNARKGL